MAWTNFAITIGESELEGRTKLRIDARPRKTPSRIKCFFSPSSSTLTSPLFHSLLSPPFRSPYRNNTVGVGSIYYLMRRDVRQGAAQLRKNAKTIKGWIEEAEASAKNGGTGGGSKPPPPPSAEPPQKQVPPPSSSSSTPNKAE